MTTWSTSCGTSPRHVLPPNPLGDADEETASHRDDEADRAPAIWAKRQDAQPVGERHDRTEQQEGTDEVAVETTAAGCVDEARGASHLKRRRPQDRGSERAHDQARDGHNQGASPEHETPD